MLLRIEERVGRIRWIFLPLGMCALAAVGAHAAADVVADRVLFAADRIGAFFDAIFSRWALTAPLVDLIGAGQRTFLARALALVLELSADALIALPLLNYDERVAAQEFQMARAMLKRRPSLRWARPAVAILVGIAGALSVARMVRGSLRLALHVAWLSQLAFAVVLFALLAVLLPRAAFRSLEHADSLRPARSALALAVLLPIALAAVLSL